MDLGALYLPFDATRAELALVAVVLLAFTIEAALGFGATLVAVALGSFFVPIDRLLPALVPCNVLLSGYLVTRHHAKVDRSFLLFRLLPAMALGLPFGQAVFRSFDASVLKRIFGVFVAIVAAIEIARMRREASARKMHHAAELGLLFAGGVVHGAFATGGPMAVYVTGRVLDDKGAYRATLSVLWLVLNLLLVGTYAVAGDLGASTLRLGLLIAPSLVVGLVLGEVLHQRVPAATFRKLVFAMLVAAGVALVIRA